MLSEKEKVALDKYITAIPEEHGDDVEPRTNDLGQTLEYFQDDNGATVAYNDTIYRLSIKTELGRMHFLVLFESAQELLDEFEEELVIATLTKYNKGREFIKEMEDMFGE